MTEVKPLILLTGATGYVGGRLLVALEKGGHRVRCLARQPDHLSARASPGTEVVRGDLLDLESLRQAMSGVTTAYYLVHSMGSDDSFQKQETASAQNFAQAAVEAGVRRIVYLGGLGRGQDLSPHLASRREVGRILRESGTTTIEFRASIIVGSGSLSFEIVRALVDRLPVMVTPRWVRVRAQPIAIEDVVAYLVSALDVGVDQSEVVEIGGAEAVTYQEMMREYARQRGLKRLMIPVPVLTPRLSSLWLGLVTPVYATIGRKLIDSIPHETVVASDLALRLFDVRPLGIKDAIARAIRNEDQEIAATRWSDALSSRGRERSWGGVRFGSRLVDSRAIELPVSPTEAFRPIERIGGKTGWYYGDWMWTLRGFLDLLFGGAGLRRGRRDPAHLAVGNTVDFWRVESITPDQLLRLRAEMKLPGRAWLQFEVEGRDGGCVIRQTSLFDPVGIPGLAYWYSLAPFHQFVFGGMLKGIARAATEESSDGEPDGEMRREKSGQADQPLGRQAGG
ncbi:MAG TPA: SDR family oxidoreductase [Dehalococcoidia bacterium]